MTPSDPSIDALPIGPDGVAALIPHSGAMRLIDQVVSAAGEEVVCTTRTHLSPDNPLRVNGALPASAAIEYAAQAMAVHAALSRGGPPRRGFLVVASGVAWTADRLDQGDSTMEIRATRLASTGLGAQYAFDLSAGPGVQVTGTLTLSLEAET
ncbi:MAG: 3-hydroxylacyl-ACP dehydratase [Alphaproteobacteria bacterium]|nr:3-hydroxylacyl-ACP dehydratase [Alphaproteobacteria bacterium]